MCTILHCRFAILWHTWQHAMAVCGTGFINVCCTRGVQNVCGLTMTEQIFKGHSMHENTTSQYKNIHQEKHFQISYAKRSENFCLDRCSCDMIMGNESHVGYFQFWNFDTHFLTTSILHFDANPIKEVDVWLQSYELIMSTVLKTI